MARARFDSISKRRLSPSAVRRRELRQAFLDGLVRAFTFFSEFFSWLYQGGKSVLRNLALHLGRLSIQTVKIALLAILVSMLRPVPIEPTGPRLADASQSVIDFHRAIDGGAYHAAYSQLTPAWQAELDFGSFKSGFHKAHRLTVESAEAIPVAGDEAYVQVALRVNQQMLIGHYRVRHDGRKWQLDGSLLRQQDDLRIAKL